MLHSLVGQHALPLDTMDHAEVMGDLSAVSTQLHTGHTSLESIRARVDALRVRMPSLSPERTQDPPALSSDVDAENRLLKDLLRASVLHNRLLGTENRCLRDIVDSFILHE
jgi:hypothetical protein